ncbi:MAG: phosphodiester glycosidase family protein [Clostridia bacterium]|nr:phosphodiester glycosidase family protein [Clostridia bacterium]
MKTHTAVRQVLIHLLIDILLTAVFLVIFALFHHVIPRQSQSVGIVIENPYKRPPAEDSNTSRLPEGSRLIAASGSLSDVSFTSKGGNRNGSQSRGGTVNSSKGGSALSETGEETEDVQYDTPIWEKFSEMYTESIAVTDTSYQSSDISVTVTQETLENGDITYYLADIYLRDITCFQSVLAGNTYGTGYRQEIPAMAENASALIAINGDYYGNTNEGVVIRNGVIYRANPTTCDVCILYYDGSMRVIPGSQFSVEEAIADGAWQAWTFGPALLNTDGSVLTDFSSTRRIIAANPRTAIGYYEPGHYCMIVVDGRGESAGITLPELSQLFYDLGCTVAYNLDGGNSSVMVWDGEVINTPSGGGRASSDALVIAEVSQYE